MRIAIKTELIAGFGFVILLMAGMVGLGIAGLGTHYATLERIVEGPAPRLERSLTVRGEMARLVWAEKSIILATDRAAANRFEAEMVQRRQALAAAIDAGIAAASEEGSRVGAPSGTRRSNTSSCKTASAMRCAMATLPRRISFGPAPAAST